MAEELRLLHSANPHLDSLLVGLSSRSLDLASSVALASRRALPSAGMLRLDVHELDD